MRGGVVVASAQHTGASCFFKVQPYPELTLQYLQWLRSSDYRLGLDIRRYFPSIHHPTLCRLLFRILHDPRTQALIQLLLASGGTIYRTPLAVQVLELERYPMDEACSLALGSYLSQWCGTFYLEGLDHFVKRELKIRGYLRYTDDFVLFDAWCEIL
jgi:RNA-directed DNA polymerase